MEKITATDIKNINRSAFGNEILYNMCKDFSAHKITDQISGKVWLIGRSYAADVGRGRKNDSINDDFYDNEVPKLFLEYYKEIDVDLSELGNSDVHSGNLSKVLSMHKKLTVATKNINKKRAQRSFSSKYLHFHARNAFFIYDSRAKESLNKLIQIYVGDKKVYKQKDFVQYDSEYADFCNKCLVLRKILKTEFDIFLQPREMDNLLIDKANSARRRKV